MTNIEKLEKDCIADMQSILRKYLDNWYVRSLALNYIELITDVGYIEIKINSKTEIKIHTYEEQFKPRDKKYMKFYTDVERYLNIADFHKVIMQRFRKYKKAGDKMIKNKIYCKEYA